MSSFANDKSGTRSETSNHRSRLFKFTQHNATARNLRLDCEGEAECSGCGHSRGAEAKAATKTTTKTTKPRKNQPASGVLKQTTHLPQSDERLNKRCLVTFKKISPKIAEIRLRTFQKVRDTLITNLLL